MLKNNSIGNNKNEEITNSNKTNQTNKTNQIIKENKQEKSKESKRRHTGAGILIITNHNNKPHILIGREEYKSFKYSNNVVLPIYEEFGGGIQSKKCSLEENALKELDEETSHIFDWNQPNVLLKKGFKFIDIPFMDTRMYRLYIIYLPNVSTIIPDFFRNRQIILNHSSTYYKRKNYIEMDDLQLLSLESISQSMRNKTKNQLNLFNNDIILKIENHDIYLSRRLYSFLSTKFNINNKEKTGLQYCYQVFNNFNNTNYKNKSLTLQKPIKTLNHKYNFLQNTITYNVL